MALSQREAARAWGVSRATIQRAIAGGKLSQTADKRIDPAEMVRVFGEPSRSESRPTGPLESTPDLAIRIAELEAKVAAQAELLASKDANLADLRSQVLMLAHDGAPRRRWWSFGGSK